MGDLNGGYRGAARQLPGGAAGEQGRHPNRVRRSGHTQRRLDSAHSDRHQGEDSAHRRLSSEAWVTGYFVLGEA